MKTNSLILPLLLLVSACSAHSPVILRPTTDTSPAAGITAQAHDRPVLVLLNPLPADIQVEVLGTVDAGRVWYSNSSAVLAQLADGGRRLGADAVVDVRRWRQPSGWAWAAPHGRGVAVRFLDPDDARIHALEGDRL